MLKFALSLYLFTGLAGAFTPNNVFQLDPSAFMYAIFKDKVPVCAGALIEDSSTEILIVTAAHCVYGIQHSRLDVILKKSKFDHQNALSVDRVKVHPYYMPPSGNYDVAVLIILKNSNTLAFISNSTNPLNLITTEPSPGDSIFLVNWNLKHQKDDELKTFKGSMEERKSCRKALANYTDVSSKMLCANFQSNAVSMPGGGPLLVESGIVGIASYSIKENLPKIFTNIANSEIYSFIKKHVTSRLNL